MIRRVRMLCASTAAVALVAFVVAGCGNGGSASRASTAPAGPSAPARSGPFAWLRPRPAPANWGVARIPNGATMAYPPGWGRVHGDLGTATAELSGSDEQVLGYLNVTPKQGPETLANWAHFRVDHNGDEGDRDVHTLRSATDLRFLTGRGSCVQDRYRTTNSMYVEVACIVAGKRATTVIVGAATPQAWRRVSPLLERAISGLRT